MFPQSISVIIVDDHPVTRKGLRMLLDNAEEIEIIAEAESGEHLFEILKTGMVPDVILLDISMPEMNGLVVMQNIKKKYKSSKVIFFSIYTGHEFIAKCIISGGDAYLSKASSGEQIIDAIFTVHKYGLLIDDDVAKVVKRLKIEAVEQTSTELTLKEEEILILICKGYLIKQIADKLSKSIKTVDYHKRHIMIKTGCKNDAQLGVYARQKGLIDDANVAPIN